MAEVEVTRTVTATNVLQEDLPDTVQAVTASTVGLTWKRDGKQIQTAFKLGEFPAAYKYKAIVGGYVALTATASSAFQFLWLKVWDLGSYNTSEIDWNNRPILSEASDQTSFQKDSGSVKQLKITAGIGAENANKLARAAGFLIETHKPFYTDDSATVYTQAASTSSRRPVFVTIVDDSIDVQSQVVQQNSPTGGHVNRAEATTFAWTLQKIGGYYCAGDFSQASATFYWKLSTDADYTTVALTTAQSVTIPAGTFPGGKIKWKVRVTDSDGNTSETPVYTFDTSDATTYAYPQSPVGVVADGSKKLRFTWTTENAYGSAPTASLLGWSTDGSTFETLASISGSATSYTAPANTFPAGTIYWRVRASNQDSVQGPRSDAVSFVNVAAPEAPAVTVEVSPFPTFRWAASGQQAYRITVDGEKIGTFFGTRKYYKLTEPLADGEHTVSVAVQNEFGMWSDDGETSFVVENVPGSLALTLSGSFGTDAMLTWQTSASAANFYIYRDGVCIGHTTGKTFTDRFSLGTHSYYVLNVFGNRTRYTKSNTVTGAMSVDATQISLASGESGWLALRLSELSSSQQSFSFSRVNAARHIAGSVFPVLELSPFEDLVAHYTTAFTDPGAIEAFESLRGKIVVLKSRGGNVVIGALTQMEKIVGDFYTSFSFSISRIDWEDYVDDANG